jgi:hypothetical protein
MVPQYHDLPKMSDRPHRKPPRRGVVDERVGGQLRDLVAERGDVREPAAEQAVGDVARVVHHEKSLAIVC